MRIQPSAKAKGARNKFARQANSKQNGLGKVPADRFAFVSFWRVPETSLSWGAASHIAAGRVAHVYGLTGLDLGRHVYGVMLCLRQRAVATIGHVLGLGVWPTVRLGMRGSVSLGLPWRTCAKVQFRDGEAVPGDLRDLRLRWTSSCRNTPHVRKSLCTVPMAAVKRPSSTRHPASRVSQFGLSCIFARLGPALVDPLRSPWQADKRFCSTTA